MTTSMGTLYLVGTPIGNMDDLSTRAASILRSVDRIAAEDTRRTGRLLGRIGGNRPPLVSFHAHNEAARTTELIERLRQGESIAVVTDAGNPGISDPAERLVRAAVEAGIDIVPVPGPSAFLAALVASGLPTVRFRFEGYLPSKAPARRKALEALRSETATLILHESPKRVCGLVKDIADLLGERPVVLAREITKKFEEFFRGSASEVVAHLDAKPPRGEYVILVGGAGEGEPLAEGPVLDLVREEVAGGRSMRDSVRTAARVAGWKEQDVYRLVREKDR